MLEIDEDGNRFWLNEKGFKHREDGPACEYANGTKIWYVNGLKHREDKPALMWSDGMLVVNYTDQMGLQLNMLMVISVGIQKESNIQRKNTMLDIDNKGTTNFSNLGFPSGDNFTPKWVKHF